MSSILPTTAVPVWLFSQNADGTLSPATVGGGGVNSLNTLTGALSLTSVAGTLIITPSGSSVNLEVSNTPAQQPLGSGSGGGTGVTGTSGVGATNAQGFISLGNGSYQHAVIHVITTDNTSNAYNFGIYNAAGTLLCSTGSIPGSTFGAGAGSKTITFTTSCTLVQGQIYFWAGSAITANTLRVSNVAGSGGSNSGDTLTPFAYAQVSASSMPASISAPVITYASSMGAGPWFGLVP